MAARTSSRRWCGRHTRMASRSSSTWSTTTWARRTSTCGASTVGPRATIDRCAALTAAGVEILRLEGDAAGGVGLEQVLKELGARKKTHVLVEGGSRLLGAFHDAGMIDEVHAFVAPSIAGGSGAASPVGGAGIERMSEALRLCNVEVRQIGQDVYVHGDVPRD